MDGFREVGCAPAKIYRSLPDLIDNCLLLSDVRNAIHLRLKVKRKTFRGGVAVWAKPEHQLWSTIHEHGNAKFPVSSARHTKRLLGRLLRNQIHRLLSERLMIFRGRWRPKWASVRRG